MSGFTIPGLGQAKPNETLPPLPADVLAAAASAHGTEDVQNEETAEPKATTNNTIQTPDDDAMVIDQPDNAPSITGALEAAIGGIYNTTQAASEQPEPAPLQPDASENPEWEIDSSPYESSSSSVSSTSSEDEDSDNEGYELLGVEETARLLMEAEAGSDDEGDRNGKGASAAQLRTKNEVPEDIVPRPDVIITEEMPLEELGVIEHIVEAIALVKASTPGEYQVLDTGSVLCTSSRVVIGAIAETIGKVLQPLYTIRFNSDEEVKELGLEVGTKIFYTAQHATFVFTEPLKSVKGSDASNLYDEEAGDDEMEFSDDEKEAEYKRSLKQKKKDKWKANNPQAQQPHPLRQETNATDAGLNYDDGDDGPYKPLARPSSFASGPPSTQSYEPQPRSNFRGGNRRGDMRGRGRGRGGRGNSYNNNNSNNSQGRDGYALPPQGGYSQQQQQPATQPTGPPAPSMPNFGFQMPPQPGSGAAISPPPPPPGWQPGQQANPGAFVNPAFIAALMSQMQSQQGGGQGNGGWGQQPPPTGQ